MDKRGAGLSLSLEGLSSSVSDDAFASFACAMARWKSSHRCLDDSFFSETTGDSDSVYLFDILLKSQFEVLKPTIDISNQRLREIDHSLVQLTEKGPRNP